MDHRKLASVVSVEINNHAAISGRDKSPQTDIADGFVVGTTFPKTIHRQQVARSLSALSHNSNVRRHLDAKLVAIFTS
jgi:cytidylate kinase